ncbi:hypothetical protein K1719_033816 [Acacia pycnantha]|nr:hypothetical protein K1719_033816 [Acacia pycnantha]
MEKEDGNLGRRFYGCWHYYQDGGCGWHDGICISNVNIKLTEKPKILQWNCTDVEGFTRNVTPKACDLPPEKEKKFDCP